MRETLRLRADVPGDVDRGASILRNGGTVAFPTETVYGLGANALEAAAVQRIFRAKERPGWDPLIVHVADRAMLERVCLLTGSGGARVLKLMEAFWPGPLTLLLPRTAEVPDAVTAGRPKVGVRMPRHEVALAFIQSAGVPVAAPSANRFGRTSPTSVEHVLEDLDGRIDAVLDGGRTSVGLESTVLDAGEWPMVIYRPGAITAEMITAVAGEVQVFRPVEQSANPESLPSPGVGLRHYAPRAQLVLTAGSCESLLEALATQEGKQVGVMRPAGWEAGEVATLFEWGPWEEADVLANRLFAGLRALDGMGVEVILCPVPAVGGLRDALRDRLEKAGRRS